MPNTQTWQFDCVCMQLVAHTIFVWKCERAFLWHIHSCLSFTLTYLSLSPPWPSTLFPFSFICSFQVLGPYFGTFLKWTTLYLLMTKSKCGNYTTSSRFPCNSIWGQLSVNAIVECYLSCVALCVCAVWRLWPVLSLFYIQKTITWCPITWAKRCTYSRSFFSFLVTILHHHIQRRYLCVYPQLYQIALKAQKEQDGEGRVKMVSYPADLGYSHNYIYLDPNLSSVVGWVM